EPLARSALAASVLALVALLPLHSASLLPSAVALAWLAGLWAVMASLGGRRYLSAASRAVLCLAVLCATTAWIATRGWLAGSALSPSGLLKDPRCLQAYGIGLCLLVFARRWTRDALAGAR